MRCAMALAKASPGEPTLGRCRALLPEDRGLWLGEQAAALRELGWTRQAQKAELVQIHGLMLERDDVEIAVPPPDPADVDLTIFRLRTLGQRALLQRQYQLALQYFDDALQQSVALGSTIRIDAAVDRRAQALARLGRFREAEALYDEKRQPTDACDHAKLENNHVWLRLLEMYQGERSPDEVGAILDRVAVARELANASTKECGVRADIELHEAFGQYFRGDLVHSSEALELARTFGGSTETRRWMEVLTAELQVARGELPQAEATWGRLEEAATENRDLEFLWRAAMARASLAWRQGRRDLAQEHVVRADAAFTQLAEGITLVDRLDAFLVLGHRGAGAEVARRVEAGDLRGALAVSRLHRRRAAARYWAPAELARVNERAAALLAERQRQVGLLAGAPEEDRRRALAAISQLDLAVQVLAFEVADRLGAADSLRSPASDEVILHVAPWEQDGALRWIVLLDTTTDVVASAPFAALPDPASALAEALRPHANLLRSRARLTLILPALFDAVDLAWMDVGFGPLLEHMTVAWSSDLRQTGSVGLPTSLALVNNPAGDPALRGAPKRGEDLLGVSGLPSVPVDPRDAESPLGLRAILERPEVDALHLVSHARFDLEPLQSAVLVRHGHLTARDVMSSARVPRFVTLAACESAATEGVLGGLGLSAAFVLAGADGVVGSHRQVNSEVAYDFYELLYGFWREKSDVREAFRKASVELKRKSPQRDVGTFRLLLAGG